MQLTSPRCVQHAQCAHQPSFSLSTHAPSPATYSASSSHTSTPPVVASSAAPCCVKTHPSSRPSPSSSSLLTASTTSSPSSPSAPSAPSHTWLTEMLLARFYTPCPIHASERKSERNIFCVSHAQVMCQYCQREAHPSTSKRPSSSSPSSLKHHLRKNANQTDNHPNSLCKILHVSRYMYHHVVPLREMSALMDVSLIQSYLNNSNKVVYLDRRAQPKSKLAPHSNACRTCNRTLQEDYKFCCVYCCLKHANHPALSRHIPLPNTGPLNNQPVRTTSRNATRSSAAKRAAPAPPSRSDPCAAASVTRSAAHTPSSPPSHSTADVATDADRTAFNASNSRCADAEQPPRLKRARKQPNPERAAHLVVTAHGTYVVP